MKSSKLGFVVLATVFASAAAFMGACSGDDSSGGSNADGTGGKKSSGGSKNDGGEAGSSSSSGGSAQGGGAGDSNADKCAGVTCKNDDNPCTEDECNPETGKCGIPRSGTSCNDGIYCNGTDKCDAGECTKHSGMPCEAGKACNEEQDTCECDSDDDCPAVEYGDWTTPTFDSVCDTTGAKNRTVKTYACVSGMCEATNSVENAEDARATDGTDCTTSGNFCTSTCKTGSCVPSTTQCKGGTPYCNEGADACWQCKNDTINALDSGCTSGAKNCCSGTCGTTSCDLIITDIVLNNTIISNQLVLN